MSKVLGIDLGTTNSCVSVLEGGKATIIANAEGGRTTPSVVGFSKDGERLVGEMAKRQAVSNPHRTVASIKRHMGSDHRVDIDGKKYSPEEISSMILTRLKRDAESYLGETVKDVVITVPAYFNDSQRQATKNAGQVAGLNVMRIINEPTAAALAYGMNKSGEEMSVIVFDLGGGTFDVSVLEIEDGVFEVQSTAGDTNLGGDDWDARLRDYVAAEFEREHGIDLLQDKVACQRLEDAAEKAKIELSGKLRTNLSLPFVSADANGPKHLDVDISRAKFEQLTEDLLERCAGPCEQALADAGISKSDIDRVLMVGGSTRMPMVVDFVTKMFGREPSKDINPDECVALGAAIQGGVLSGEVKDVVLVDVTPLTLGLETMGGVMTKLVPRNTAIPAKRTELFSTAADGQTSVEVHVLQGEREMAGDNKTLGRFHLNDLPPAARGVPQIEVTFELDSNGILNVSAKDKGTGKEQAITITASTNLSENEVEKLVRDAEAHAEADKARRQVIEQKNAADSLVYQAEKSLRENGDKMSPQVKAKLETAKERVTQTLEKEPYDARDLDSASEQLQQAILEVSSSQFQEAASEGPVEGEVVDADFEMKSSA